MDVSIHHMLLFIFKARSCCRCSSAFQYITCYSLSVCPDVQFFGYKVFQYITCYSLSNLQSSKIIVCRSFNTSHVTLYPDGLEEDEYIYLFQYITCYSLSWHLIHNGSPNLCFNTSHVTLYHRGDINIRCVVKFQYITCYSLSGKRKSSDQRSQ